MSLALRSTPGDDALSSIRQIADEALEYLEPGGLLAFEHGFDQGSDSRKILEETGLQVGENDKRSGKQGSGYFGP